MTLSATLNIARRDIAANFVTPVFYAIAAAFVLLSGFFFFSILSEYNTLLHRAAMLSEVRPNLNDQVIVPYYRLLEIVLVFLIPLLTMRCLAEERQNGTFELLMTSPVSLHDIVVGKFLAQVFLLTALFSLAFVFPAVLMIAADPEAIPIFVGGAGLLIFACAYAAAGLAVSCFTKSQVIAGAVSLILLLLLHVIDAPAADVTGYTGEFLRYLAPANHVEDLVRGVVESSDLIYLLSFGLTGLIISNSALASERFRNV